jgi:hypothetical protein
MSLIGLQKDRGRGAGTPDGWSPGKNLLSLPLSRRFRGIRVPYQGTVEPARGELLFDINAASARGALIAGAVALGSARSNTCGTCHTWSASTTCPTWGTCPVLDTCITRYTCGR